MAGDLPVGPGVLAERFAAQLLLGEQPASAVAVVRRLLAVQGQDPRGVRLAVRVRSAGLTAADVDRALTDDRALLITWLNRGTLHLVTAEDYWWLHPLTAPRSPAGSARRLAQEGVPPADAERAVGVVETALTADGPLVRRQLGERIAAAGVRTEGQALVHILFLASSRGIAVRGPMIGGEHAFVLVRDWLGVPPPPLDHDLAVAELSRRYLAGHGPASERDLAQWAGLPLRDARRGLAAIAGQLTERDDGLADLAVRVPGGHQRERRSGAASAGRLRAERPREHWSGAAPEGRVRDTDQRAGSAVPPPLLLGAYDPVLLGWASREPILGAYQRAITVNGLFRPFALVRGKAAGIWRLSGGEVTLSPFTALPAADEAALQADAADVQRFLGVGSAGAAH